MLKIKHFYADMNELMQYQTKKIFLFVKNIHIYILFYFVKNRHQNSIKIFSTLIVSTGVSYLTHLNLAYLKVLKYFTVFHSFEANIACAICNIK